MKYDVKLTSQAIIQISEIINYISNVLNTPQNAKSWSNHLKERITNLNMTPSRFPVLDRKNYKEKEIRKMVVHNFNVYYYVDEEKKTVWVIAVVYSKRDQLNFLKGFIPINDPH